MVPCALHSHACFCVSFTLAGSPQKLTQERQFILLLSKRRSGSTPWKHPYFWAASALSDFCPPLLQCAEIKSRRGAAPQRQQPPAAATACGGYRRRLISPPEAAIFAHMESICSVFLTIFGGPIGSERGADITYSQRCCSTHSEHF